VRKRLRPARRSREENLPKNIAGRKTDYQKGGGDMMTCDVKINGKPIYQLNFVNLGASLGLKTKYSVKSIHFDEKATKDRLGTHYMIIRTVWHNPKDGALELLRAGIEKLREDKR